MVAVAAGNAALPEMTLAWHTMYCSGEWFLQECLSPLPLVSLASRSEKIPPLARICWLLQSVLLPASFFVFAMYWGLVYDGDFAILHCFTHGWDPPAATLQPPWPLVSWMAPACVSE